MTGNHQLSPAMTNLNASVPALEIRGLMKRYESPADDGINLIVRTGEF
jgi:hypothetical protein